MRVGLASSNAGETGPSTTCPNTSMMANDDHHYGRAASSCATSSRSRASCLPPTRTTTTTPPSARYIIPQHATERGAATGPGERIARAGARVLLAVEPACRVDAGRAAGSGAAVECDAHPFPHAHAVRFFARGHRVEMGRVFGIIDALRDALVVNTRRRVCAERVAKLVHITK